MDINKLPPGVREALRERGRKEAEVTIMTPREIFEDYCNWNGIINWSDTLWDTATALMNVQAAPTFPATYSAEKLAEIQGFRDEVGVGANMPKADGEPKKVVVLLTGGIVDEVLVGDEGVPVSVAVIDIDKNADLDDLVVIPEEDGETTFALTAIHTASVNAARVEELYAAVEEGKPASEDERSLRP